MTDPKSKPLPRWLVVVFIAVFALFLFNVFFAPKSKEPKEVNYPDFIAALESGSVVEATVVYDPSRGWLDIAYKKGGDGPGFHTGTALTDPGYDNLFTELEASGIDYTFNRVADPSFFSGLFGLLLPILLMVALFVFLMRRMGGGGAGGPLASRMKSGARKKGPDRIKTTFADVAGIDEAVEEMREIRDYLVNAKKYMAKGAKIPRGILLYGPSGTGKTLLAQALAGETNAAFYSISGSEFVEMFVGLGAARVRNLFEEAKQNNPAIVFIDEIDAVGGTRGRSLTSHDEREQTLNQILVEMDGFNQAEGVILIAATNRPDTLDPALLRPGRFGRHISVDLPDLRGRKAILRIHAKGKPLANADYDLDTIARRTPGFTGADLAELINEAAILVVRREKEKITLKELRDAIDRVIAGPERRTRVIPEKQRRVVAYHEAGHAIVGHFLPKADPVQKITIIGRGQSLGHTLSIPEEDQFLVSEAALRDQIAMSLGGRAAEELVFKEITTGAASDLESVARLAKDMITRYGMSKIFGPRMLGKPSAQQGWDLDRGYSSETEKKIDEEIDGIVRKAHVLALRVLTQRRADLDLIADMLIAHETIEREQFTALLEGKSEDEVFAEPESNETPQL